MPSAIDAEALEQSYHDSWGIDSRVINAAAYDGVVKDSAHDSVGQETVPIGASELDAATADIDIMIFDAAESAPAAVDSTALDYDLFDLDATAQHVQMPSDLHDRPVVSERRTSIVDALRTAIDRDPQRHDLRMKLLETYYGAAAVNQRAFMEVVRQLSCEREFLSTDDWRKVTMMAREIAPDDGMFSDQPKDDLADCA